MRETASLLAASAERKGRILPYLRNWQKRIRHRYLICTPMESVSSTKTPRFPTDWKNGMPWPELDTGVRLGVAWLILDFVPMAMSSVLSSFIFNLLSLIHSATSMQSFKRRCKEANTPVPVFSRGFNCIWMQFAMLLRFVRLMNLIFIWSRPINIQERESPPPLLPSLKKKREKTKGKKLKAIPTLCEMLAQNPGTCNSGRSKYSVSKWTAPVPSYTATVLQV